MSIVKTLDVFCDFPGCLDWTHGVTANKVSSSAARKSAKRNGGFVNRRMGGQHYDLCPQHKHVTLAVIEDARAEHEATAIPANALDDAVEVPIGELQGD